MAATSATNHQMRPACYADWCSDVALWQRAGDEWLRIVRGSAMHCPSNMAGESYLCGWRWEGVDIGGSQGHVPVTRYTDAFHYRCERQSEPRLWVYEGPDPTSAGA